MAWAEIEAASRMVAIGVPDSEHHLAKLIPGCNYAEGDQLWRFPLTWPGYVALRTAWGSWPLQLGLQLETWAASAWRDVQIAYGLRSAMEVPGGEMLADLADVELNYRESGRALWPFQMAGAAWLVTQKRVVCGDSPGSGKTPQVITAYQVLRKRGVPGPMLVVARSAALYNWRDELAMWAPDLTVSVVSGTAAKRRAALETEADVYVVSWDSVRIHTRLAAYGSQRLVRCHEHGGTEQVTVGRCEVHEKELNAIPFSVIVADEAHAMKDPTSKQSRAVSWLAQRAEYFWPVTGTPVGDTIADFWPIGHAIDPRGFPSKPRFLQMFAIEDYAWNRGSRVLGLRPDNEAAFHTIVQPLIRRIPKELARPQMPGRLPEVVFRYPEMEPGQAKMYKQIAKEMLADVGPGDTIVAANHAVKFGRLCQLAASSVKIMETEGKDGFPKEVVELAYPSPKISDLVEFLADNPGPLVVAANSPRLIELAEKALNDHQITTTKIIGGMTDMEKHTANRWFQDGQVRVIFINSAGSESINLTAADTIFFLQPDPSFRSREQKIGRVDRMGQASPVRTVVSVAPGTVEERLYRLGNEKEERAGQVTRDADLLRWMIQGDDHDSPVPGGAQLRLPAGHNQPE